MTLFAHLAAPTLWVIDRLFDDFRPSKEPDPDGSDRSKRRVQREFVEARWSQRLLNDDPHASRVGNKQVFR